jgi:uncharacterized protein (DUF1697 family)
MDTYIALLRGINVGGRNVLRMKELRALLEGLGLQDVRTYIQSGNVVFQSEEADAAGLASEISAAIEASHGFEPRVLVLPREEVERAMAANPFSEAEAEPKRLHLNFLASVPEDPDLEALQELKKESERFALKGKVFYLHAPEGIGRSKLYTNAERALGVAMTGRNWRTVSKIMALAREAD